MINKKAISPVVATVLLIVITVVAVLFISSVIIPMIKSMTKKGIGCYEVMSKILIDRTGYTCSNDSGTYLTIMRKDDKIEQIAVKISTRAETIPFVLKDRGAERPSGGSVEMLRGGEIKLPPKGGSKTYIFKCDPECKNASSVAVMAKIDEEECGDDSIELSKDCEWAD